MKKDIFNGNIEKDRLSELWFILIFVFVLMIGIAIFCFIIVNQYDKFGPGAKEAVIALGVFSLCIGIGYPILIFIFVRKYPKYKRFCHLLLKPYMFNNTK